MPVRKHVYTCKKGYADQYKGREVSWDNFTTIPEAISAGHFDSEETLLRKAYNSLNIDRGHAIMKATQEFVKDADGKETTTLARPAMTLAEMEKLAAATNAKRSDRAPKGTGGQKQQVKQFQTAKEKARQVAATANPEKLAELLGYGLIDQAEHDARLAAWNSANQQGAGSAPKAGRKA